MNYRKHKFKIFVFLLDVVFIVALSIGIVAYEIYIHEPDYVIPDDFVYEDTDDITPLYELISLSSTVEVADTKVSYDLYLEDYLDIADEAFDEYFEEESVTPVAEADTSEVSDEEDSEKEEEVQATFYCNAENSLNVRALPSSDSDIIGGISHGEAVSVITSDTSSDDWAKILWEDGYAYVASSYLSEDPVPEYTEADVYLLAQVIFAEAGGVSDARAEMARVGQVFLNRLHTDYKEFRCCTTMWSTLSHKNAYPTTLRKIQNGLVPSEDALEVARGLLDGSIDSGLSEDVLWQTGSAPSWNAVVVYHSDTHYYSVLGN